MLHTRKRFTVAALGGVIVLMIGLVAASVPLYRWFCEVTGYGGTTQRADVAGRVADRIVTVRFSADVAPGLPWRFRPEQPEVKVRLGEETLVFFSAENLTDEPIVGHATFNVTPAETGRYFNRIQCFCFDEERLGARQKVDMPVDFFVDPALAENPETREVNTITLAYTFFRSAEPGRGKDLSRFHPSDAPDSQRGEALFADRCSSCHALDRSKTGPALAGVFGRTAAAVAGYTSSPTLRGAGLRWTGDNLDLWLANPRKFVPGTRMPVRVIDPTTRRDIIAFLKTTERRVNAAERPATTP